MFERKYLFVGGDVQHSNTKVVPNFYELTKNIPEGKWVMLSNDHTKVVGQGDTVDEAKTAARQNGHFSDSIVVCVRRKNFHGALHTAQFK